METGDWVWVDAYKFAGRLVRPPLADETNYPSWIVEWVLTPYWEARTIKIARGFVDQPVLMSWSLPEIELRPHTPSPEEEEIWLLAKLSR